MKRAIAGWQTAAGKIPVPLWLIAAVISAQFASSVSVPLIHRFGSTTATSLRLIWAALVLLLMARPRLWGFGARQLRGAVLLGVIIAGMSFCFFAAVGRIPIGTVVSIEFLGPLAVTLAGSRRLLDLAWAFLAALGVWLLTRHEAGTVDVLGYSFAGGSAVCWGGYILLTRRVGRAFSGVQGLALSLSVAALVGVPIGVVPHWHALDWTPVVLMALIAMLSPVLTYSLEMASLRRMEPRHFGILMSLEPVVAAVMGFLVLGQRLSLPQLTGMACVTLASFGTVAASPKKT